MGDNEKQKSGQKREEFKFTDTDSLKAQVMAALKKDQAEKSADQPNSTTPKKTRVSKSRLQTENKPSRANGESNPPHDHDRFSRRIEQRLKAENAGETEKTPPSATKKKAPKKSTAEKNRPRLSKTASHLKEKSVNEKKAGTPDKLAPNSETPPVTQKVKPKVTKNAVPKTAGPTDKEKAPTAKESPVQAKKTPVQKVAATKKDIPIKSPAVTKEKNPTTPRSKAPSGTGKFIPKSTRERLAKTLALPSQEEDFAQESEKNPVKKESTPRPTTKKSSSNQPNTRQGENTGTTNPEEQHNQPASNNQTRNAAHHAELITRLPKKQKKSIADFLEEVETLPEEQRRKVVRKKENSLVHRIVMILLIVFVAVAIILAVSFWNFWQSGQKPLNTSDSKTEMVEIPLGSSNKQIASILEDEKIIKSAVVFNYYMKLNNQSGFQAGFYELAPNMTLDKIAKKLKDGESVKQVVAIPEGYSADQIAAAVEEKTPYTAKEFLAVLKDDQFFAEMLKKYPKLLTDASKSTNERYKLEGYLFPATYTLTPGSDVEGLVTQMVQKADSVMSQYYDVAAAANLNVHEVMTLASLVEKEGVKDEDRRNIAKVFLNRLAIDMPLQSDISILYAMDEHKVTLTVEDTKIDSPYNLYVNKGYGPGPFDSPSENAIKAVLYPADNSYYYFVADVDTGTVYFAQTFEEHSALVDQYVNKK